MAQFDLENYSTVQERIAQFYQDGTVRVRIRGGEVLVDRSDLPTLDPYNWRVQTVKGGKRYAVAKRRGATVLMHRLLMDAPTGSDVDHRNGRGLDNRRANLRVCSRRENARNQKPKGGASRWKGVSPSGAKWMAKIRAADGRQKYLGSFVSEIDAALAYDAAARQEHGEFAHLNFPERRVA